MNFEMRDKGARVTPGEPDAVAAHPPARIDARAVSEPGRIDLDLCGRSWTLARPCDLESLWEAVADDAFDADERLPYWVELWPSSLALALWLAANRGRIAGHACLDLGCGLGFTAMVASWLGARVIGMDYEVQALEYARANAAANAVPQPTWVAMDWRRPALAPGGLEFVWGGDIMYENRFVEPVFTFLEYALAREGIAWIAEPGRGAYDRFMGTVLRRGWRSRRVADHKVAALHAQEVPVSVTLWELSRR